MFNLRKAFTFWAVLLSTLGAVGHSQAQTATVTLQAPVFSRAGRGNLTNKQINYEDCHAEGSKITFPLTLTNPSSSLTLEVWAGSACDTFTNRQTSNLVGCKQLGGSLAASAATPQPIEIPVRDILYLRTQASGTTSSSSGAGGTGGAGGASAAGGSGGADSASGTGGTSGSGAAGGTDNAAGTTGATNPSVDLGCTNKDEAVTGAQTITLFFLLLDSGKMAVGTFAKLDFNYKLAAPLPPDKVSVKIGENLLPISFDYSSTIGDNTVNEYNFFCDPPPGTAVAMDAGVFPEDQNIVTMCGSDTKLVAGEHPDPAMRCGKTGSGSKHGNATGLTNGVAYHVAVATTDAYQNVGVLSPSDCQVPQPVTGFFEAYRDAGGKGGGGFCSFSPRPEPLPFLSMLGVASCLLLRRRRAA